MKTTPPRSTAFIWEILYNLWTLFLFTRSDIKTAIIPCTVFGAAVAPIASASRIPHALAWQWVQVLAFNLANQGLNPEEDRLNKPYRPIPSGRISEKSTLRLRWIVVAFGLIHSAFYSLETVYCALGVLLVTYLYCDLRMDTSHWIVRSCIGGFGFVPNFVGAALVAGNNRHGLDGIAWNAVYMSVGACLTTFHCQDFGDVDGDRKVGRRTIPMVYPTLGRVAYMFFVIFWSIVMSVLWNLDTAYAWAFVAYSFLCGTSVILFRSAKAEQINYKLFQFWKSAIFTIPGYYRYVGSKSY